MREILHRHAWPMGNASRSKRACALRTTSIIPARSTTRRIWPAATFSGPRTIPRNTPVTVLPGRCGWRFMAGIFALRTAALDRIDRLYSEQ